MATATKTPRKSTAKAAPAPEKARGNISRPIMKWQYEQVIKELLLLQGHAADPTCPCKSEGEMCVRKHLLTVEALLVETAAMEKSDTMIGVLNQHHQEAMELRQIEEGYLCGGELKGAALDKIGGLADWARMTRKVYEEYSLACSMKSPKAPAPAPVPEAVPAPAPLIEEKTCMDAVAIGEPVFEITAVAELDVIPAPAPSAKTLLMNAYKKLAMEGGDPDGFPELNKPQNFFLRAFAMAGWPNIDFNGEVRSLPYQDATIEAMERAADRYFRAGKWPKTWKALFNEVGDLTRGQAVVVWGMGPLYRNAYLFASGLYDLTLTDPEHWKAAGHDFPAPSPDPFNDAPDDEEFQYAERRAMGIGSNRRAQRSRGEFRLYKDSDRGPIEEIGQYSTWQELIKAANKWFQTEPGTLYYYSPEGDGPLDRRAAAWHLEKQSHNPPAPAPGLVAEVCSGLQEGKDTHVHFLGVPPDPKTGDHAWHRKWVDLYSKAQTVVGCSGGI